jgi:hypothetical protein
MTSTYPVTFDAAIGIIAWKHPEVAYAIRTRARDANTPRRADRVREQAIAIAKIVAAAGEGGVPIS